MESQNKKEGESRNDIIDVVCEKQKVGDCCNGLVRTLYSSAQASDGQGSVVLYGLDQGQDPESRNRCGLQLVKDDECATVDVPMGSAAGVLGVEGGDEDPRTDMYPTDGTAEGEDDGGGDHGDQQAQDVPPKKETWIEKNAKVKRGAGGCRQQQFTAYAVRSGGNVWKLSRDSEHAPAFEALTDPKEQVDFVKRYGVAEPWPRR